jgi:hypothetical protein
MQQGDRVTLHGYECNGQTSHAAIVTQVINPGLVNVTVFPDMGTAKHYACIPVIGGSVPPIPDSPFIFVTPRAPA